MTIVPPGMAARPVMRSSMAVSTECVATDDQETDLTSDAALDELGGVLCESHRRIPS